MIFIYSPKQVITVWKSIIENKISNTPPIWGNITSTIISYINELNNTLLAIIVVQIK